MAKFIRYYSRALYLGAAAATSSSTLSLIVIGKDDETYYGIDEVRKFDGRNGKPTFVIFRGGVYDVSEFKKEHPGGHFIEQAAGGDVEPFWRKWAYHYQSNKVEEILKKTRVGTLIECVDSSKVDDYFKDNLNQLEIVYKDDPKRTKQHKILMQKPFASETLPEALKEYYLTPASALYIRNHAPVPNYLEFASHEIVFSLEDKNPVETICTLSLQDILDKYPSYNVVSVLQCAGNRASEYIKATQGASGFVGTPFEDIQIGMVGNMFWNGVSLQKVLEEIFPNECREERNSAEDRWHVLFQGADEYETSTPLSYILDDKAGCLLSIKMNGELLSSDHGYPVRCILPGIVGARCVKWLQSIKLSKEPSKSPWNSHYYKRKDGSQIQQLPLNSIILSPVNGDTVKKQSDGEIYVTGIAYHGDSWKSIQRVEISADNGETWVNSNLLVTEAETNDSNVNFGWIRFEASINVPLSNSNSNFSKDSFITIMCRAVDTDGEVQPEMSKNGGGYLYNGWHTIKFIVV